MEVYVHGGRIGLRDVFPFGPRAQPAAAKRPQVAIHCHQHAARVRSGDEAMVAFDCDVNFIIERVSALGGQAHIGKQPQPDARLGRLVLRSFYDPGQRLTVHPVYVALQFPCREMKGS